MADVMKYRKHFKNRVKNFGRNFTFEVENYRCPDDEDEVLGLLQNVSTGSTRAVGSLHCWNTSVAVRDQLLDLGKLKAINVHTDDNNRTLVSAQAGCTVDEVLEKLRARNKSLPTFGIIGKQSIAGAISTATHGSGNSSMSHHVIGARFAAYDKKGIPKLYQWKNHDRQLPAARCAVGCMGVLLEVTMACTDRSLVYEKTMVAESIKTFLSEQSNYPLQQFYLVPFVWQWYGQLRRPHDRERSPRGVRRWYYFKRFWKIEFFFNLAVKFMAAFRVVRPLFPAFYRWMYKKIAANKEELADYADRILMMKGDLFPHLEMELFVRPDRVFEASEFIEGVLRWCAGETPKNFGAISQTVSCHGDTKTLAGLKNSYHHHYPITYRHVLKDETMISMTNDGNAYAISFITYSEKTDTFEAAMKFLANVMASAYGARAHWGKWMPSDAKQTRKLYPRLVDFRTSCEEVDPAGVFRNDFVNQTLWET